MAKCKVTVIRKDCHKDLQNEYVNGRYSGTCPMFEVGQEFIFDHKGYESMNGGEFCMEAYDAIHKFIYAALQGGSLMKGYSRDEAVKIACCNDGTRPVIFRIERMDERSFEGRKLSVTSDDMAKAAAAARKRKEDNKAKSSDNDGTSGSDMSFDLWLFAIKKLAQTFDASLLIYNNLDEEEKKKLKEEYERTMQR